MRILIVRTFPDIMNINAYNVQEIGLAKALIMQGNVCDIVLYHGKNPDKEEIIYFRDGKGETEHQLKIYWLKGYNLVKNGFMPSLKKIIPNYDVIQVDEYDLIFSWMLYTKPIRPTVVYHGLYKSEYTKGYNLKCAVFDKIFLPMRKHDHVIALTKSYMAADFLREKGFCQIYPVGVGIDQEIFLTSSGSKQQEDVLLPPKTRCRLLYVGKIEKRRNSLWLIELLRNLLNRHEQLELVIIGRGEEDYQEQFLKKAAPFIDSGTLIYIPAATQRQLACIYPTCDLFIFPSNYEIFGMVLLEAMYFGIPVISSLNGGSSLLIEDGTDGRIINEFNVETWSDAIMALVQNDSMRRSFGERAADKIRKRFLWTSLCQDFLYAYKQAIDEFEGEKQC